MLRKLSITLSLTISLGCATVAAQQVRMIGELELVGGTYRLATAGVVLDPGMLDLTEEVGQVVDVHGMLVVGAVPPALSVSSATRSDDTFELKGSRRIGDALDLKLDSPTATHYYFVASLAPDLIPLAGIPHVSGTAYVELPTLTVGSGTMQGSWTQRSVIPNIPALVGFEVWYQAAMFDGSVFTYLNVEHLVIMS